MRHLSPFVLVAIALLGLCGCPGGGGGGGGVKAVTPTWLPPKTISYMEVNELQSMKEKLLGLKLVADREGLEKLIDEGWEKAASELDDNRTDVEVLLKSVDHVRVGLVELDIDTKSQTPIVKAVAFLGTTKLDVIQGLMKEGGLPELKEAGEAVAGTQILGVEKAGPTSVYVAKTKDQLVVTTDRPLMVQVLKNMKTPPAKSLANDANFKKLTGKIQGAELWGYMRSERFQELSKKMREATKMPEEFAELQKKLGGGNGSVAFATRFQGGRVSSTSVYELQESNAIASIFLQPADTIELRELAPKDSLFLAAIRIEDPVGTYKKIIGLAKDMEKAMGARRSEIDQALAEIQEELGINVEADIIPAMKGELALFWPRGGDYYVPTDIVFAATIDKKKTETLLTRFHTAKDVARMEWKEEKVDDGALLKYFEGKRANEKGGYLLGENRFLVSGSPDMLKKVFKGELGSLSENETYEGATSGLPKKVSKFVYVNAGLAASMALAGPYKTPEERKWENARNAQNKLFSILSAQQQYLRKEGKLAARMSDLSPKYLHPSQAKDKADGYTFTAKLTEDKKILVLATPDDPKGRHLLMDSSYRVRSEVGKPATLKSDRWQPYRDRPGGGIPRFTAEPHKEVAKYVNVKEAGLALATVESDKRLETHSNLPVSESGVAMVGAAAMLPAMVRARQRAQEMRGQSLLHQIRLAQDMYKTDRGSYADSLEELAEGGYIDQRMLKDIEKSGYTIEITLKGGGFRATAKPSQPGLTTWETDEKGRILRR